MIRALEKKDIPACVEISKAIFALENYEHNAEERLRACFDETQLIRPVFLLFEENQIVKGLIGYSENFFDSGVYGVFMCYVHPDFQFKGIGRALTERAISDIRKKGGLSILATTRKKWHFERFGFKSIFSPYPDWDVMQAIL
jgi:predicted N-acetyltransferase YhbS